MPEHTAKLLNFTKFNNTHVLLLCNPGWIGLKGSTGSCKQQVFFWFLLWGNSRTEMFIAPSALDNFLSVISHSASGPARPTAATPHRDEEHSNCVGEHLTPTCLSHRAHLFFYLLVWDCPVAVCYLKVPLCLMLISVIFVLYYSYTLCLWMLKFQRFETMDKMPWQSICPGVGQMVVALPIGFTLGEGWKSSPGAWNQQKAPKLLHWERLQKKWGQKVWSSATSTPRGFWPSCESIASPVEGDLLLLLQPSSAQGPRHSLSSNEILSC